MMIQICKVWCPVLTKKLFVLREGTLSMKEGAGGFYRLFNKYFVAQGTIELNISLPSNFFDIFH